MTTENKNIRDQIKENFEQGDRPTQKEFYQWIDADLIQGADNIYSYDNKIGIGTDTPEAPLSVTTKENQLSFKASGDFSEVNALMSNSTFRITHHNIGEGTVAISADDEQKLTLGHFVQSDKSFKPELTINKDGNIGIGTEDPKVLLDLQGQDPILQVNESRLTGYSLALKGEHTKIVFDNEASHFEISTAKDKFQIFALNSPEQKASIQVSKNGNIGLGGGPDNSQNCNSDQNSNLLSVHGNTRINGNISIDGTIKSPEADLEVKSVQLGSSVDLTGMKHAHCNYTTHYLDIKKSALQTKTLRTGEGYSTKEVSISLKSKKWYTIAQLPSFSTDNELLGSTASFMVNIRTENPNARSSLIFTVAVSNTATDNPLDTADISVSLNSNYLPTPTSKITIDKIRLCKCGSMINLEILTGSEDLKFNEGQFAILYNPVLNPWLPVPWGESSASGSKQLEVSLVNNQVITTQAMQIVNSSDKPTSLLSSAELKISQQDKGEASILVDSNGDGFCTLKDSLGDTQISLSSEEKSITIGENIFVEKTYQLTNDVERKSLLLIPKDEEFTMFSINTPLDSVNNIKESLKRQSFQTGDRKHSTFHIVHPSPNMIHLGGNFKNEMQFGNFSFKFFPHLTIKNNGNVGIGITDPTEKLHVDGSALIKDKLEVDGKVGIGTSVPTEKLHVNGSAIIQGMLKLGACWLSFDGTNLLLTLDAGDNPQTYSINMTPV